MNITLSSLGILHGSQSWSMKGPRFKAVDGLVISMTQANHGDFTGYFKREILRTTKAKDHTSLELPVDRFVITAGDR